MQIIGYRVTSAVVAIVSSLFIASPASAATVAELAIKWGLIGTWALDCSVDADRGNGARLSYVARGGKVFHNRDFGDVKDSQEVTSVRINSDNTLELVVWYTALKQKRQVTMMKVDRDALRAVSNREIGTDNYTVHNSKFTANGRETPVQNRCP